MIDFKEVLAHADNPITRGILAAGGTVAAITATTAFAPIGVVGAAGWSLVYCVFGGTMTIDTARRLWNTYTEMSAEKRAMFNEEMDKLKRLLEEDVISQNEFKKKAKNLYSKYAG